MNYYYYERTEGQQCEWTEKQVQNIEKLEHKIALSYIILVSKMAGTLKTIVKNVQIDRKKIFTNESSMQRIGRVSTVQQQKTIVF